MVTGINKYLIGILIIFIVIILFLLSSTTDIQNPLPDFLRNPNSSLSPAITQTPPRDPNQKKAGELFAQNTKENPINKIAFEDVRSQVGSSGNAYTSENRIHGKIIDISYPDGGMTIHVQSYLVNWKNKELWVGWDKATTDKITYYADENKTTKIASTDIKEGDEIYIDETNDYSKTYPESITAIAIIKIP